MKKVIPLLLGKYINTLAYLSPKTAGKHGFKLFCYPFRVPLKSYHRQWLNTAEKSQIDIDGGKIQVFKWGTGDRKILFLHGWQSHTFRWKNYVERFPLDQFTLIAIDAPGHGLSSGSYLTVPYYSDAVEEIINTYGEIHTVISHSLGAFTALYTLYRLPELPVKRLVLLASPGDATEFIEFYKQTLKLNSKALQAIHKHFEKVITEPVSYFSAPKFASTLTHHSLIIHDEGDDETSHQNSVAIHRSMKGSTLVITQGLGHNLKSKEIVDKVFDFVEAVPANVPMQIA
jgi:esterase/lipase